MHHFWWVVQPKSEADGAGKTEASVKNITQDSGERGEQDGRGAGRGNSADRSGDSGAGKKSSKKPSATTKREGQHNRLDDGGDRGRGLWNETSDDGQISKVTLNVIVE